MEFENTERILKIIGESSQRYFAFRSDEAGTFSAIRNVHPYLNIFLVSVKNNIISFWIYSEKDFDWGYHVIKNTGVDLSKVTSIKNNTDRILKFKVTEAEFPERFAEQCLMSAQSFIIENRPKIREDVFGPENHGFGKIFDPMDFNLKKDFVPAGCDPFGVFDPRNYGHEEE